jgi:hypothetical protein
VERKIQQKSMVGTITWTTKRKAKERPKEMELARTKEGRELVLLMVRRYFTHNLSNNIANHEI